MDTNRHTNIRKGEKEVEFGADARIIRLDLNTICIWEQNLQTPFHGLVNALGINAVREALFVGMRSYGNRSASRADVGTMMASGDQSFQYYAACVLEAIQGPTGEDFSTVIGKLRAGETAKEEEPAPDEDAHVEGCDGPDAGNPTPAQSA